MRKILLLLTLLLSVCLLRAAELVDICIYGGTSSGVMAAYTARKAGKKVLLVEPTDRVGGLTTGGLGATDIGNPYIMKGYTYDFYKRIGQYYGTSDMHFAFEPKVALQIYQEYIDEAGVKVLYNHRLFSVQMENNKIKYIVVEDSKNPMEQTNVTIWAKEYIDCSYEGDLMANSNVSFTTGREGNEVYGETWNGAFWSLHHQFPDYVDPYVVPGHPESGLLYGILPGDPTLPGQGDKHIQAYNYRITLTDDPANMIPIIEPENYDPKKYELIIRLKERSPFSDRGLEDIFIWSRMPNHKTDINNRGG
ncbi:MAG: FAD-dependent oxidoreductase, partial [Bacteroidaceae bacterium]|nr:FAD-dependent oxidoreductase [Bacteroidaceae bacterium]